MRALASSRLFLAALLCAPLGLGCDVDGEEPPVGSEALQVGGADYQGTGFVELTDGQDVELVPGAQGGYHVWLNVRVHGAEGSLYLRREARRVVDNVLVLRGLPAVVDVPAEAMTGWWESPLAAPAFMCPSPIGIKVFDEELTFKVLLTDRDGEVLTAEEVVLRPRCPEGDLNAHCRDVCAG